MNLFFSKPLVRLMTSVVVCSVFFALTRLNGQESPEEKTFEQSSLAPIQPKIPIIQRHTQLSSNSIDDLLASIRAFDQRSGHLKNEKERMSIQLSIQKLVRNLEPLEVSLVILEPNKEKAQGEWNYRRREIRIHPSVLKSGLKRFSNTFHHEVIHVIQSCIGGGVNSSPRPIGLTAKASDRVKSILQKPPYAGSSPLVIELETEAFMHQEKPDLVNQMLTQFCHP
tara:strand:- start:966 stop:1640 length:675 start_codon:yes stop_codon:yes gene_type:complete